MVPGLERIAFSRPGTIGARPLATRVSRAELPGFGKVALGGSPFARAALAAALQCGDGGGQQRLGFIMPAEIAEHRAERRLRLRDPPVPGGVYLVADVHGAAQ